MMLISMGDSVAADTGSGSILGKSADRLLDTLRVLTADLVHYSTNMPKLLKNLYNEPIEKARGRFTIKSFPLRRLSSNKDEVCPLLSRKMHK
jgi:hypothetical protein